MSYGFQAPIGLVGVETGDGTVLPMPEEPDSKSWLSELPLPLYGTVLDRREKVSAGVIGRVDDVSLHDNVLWARGQFENSTLARDYAGACRVHAAYLSVDVTGTPEPLPERAGLALRQMSEWTAVSVSAVRASPWGLPGAELTPVSDEAVLPADVQETSAAP